MSQGFFVNLSANDQVTFTCMTNLNGGGGTKNIGIGGAADPAQTFISGFIVSGGGGGGVTSVSAGINIDFTGGDPVHAPIINVVDAPTFAGVVTGDQTIISNGNQSTADGLIVSYSSSATATGPEFLLQKTRGNTIITSAMRWVRLHLQVIPVLEARLLAHRLNLTQVAQSLQIELRRILSPIPS